MQVRLRLLAMEGNCGLEEQPPADHGTELLQVRVATRLQYSRW